MADVKNYVDVPGTFISAIGKPEIYKGKLVKATSAIESTPIIEECIDDDDVFLGVVVGQEPTRVAGDDDDPLYLYTVQISGYAVTYANLACGWHNVAFKDGELDDTGDGSGRGINVINGDNGKIGFIF